MGVYPFSLYKWIGGRQGIGLCFVPMIQNKQGEGRSTAAEINT